MVRYTSYFVDGRDGSLICDYLRYAEWSVNVALRVAHNELAIRNKRSSSLACDELTPSGPMVWPLHRLTAEGGSPERSTRRWRVRLIALGLLRVAVLCVLSAGVFGACRPSDIDTSAPMQLLDGSALASIVTPNGETVVLAIDPGDVASCYSIVPTWLDLSRRSRLSVRVVLTREPTPNELKVLKLARIRVTGVLAARPSAPGVVVHEFRFRDGVLVEMQSIPTGVMTSHMLERAQSHVEDGRHAH